MTISQDKVLKVLTSGLLKFAGPEVLSGMLSEFLGKITVKEIAIWVTLEKRIWDEIPPGYQSQLKKFSANLDNLDWLTVEWAVLAVKGKNPGVASLFINWPEAREYLAKQLVDMKEEIAKL